MSSLQKLYCILPDVMLTKSYPSPTMPLTKFTVIIISFSFFISCHNKTSLKNDFPVSDTVHVQLEEIVGGLQNPVDITEAGDHSGSMYILLQEGKILKLKRNDKNYKPFLDISDRVDRLFPEFTELGLLGLTFHPDFENNGRLFVFYSHKITNENKGVKVRISEFRLNTNSIDQVDPSSERIILELNFKGLFVIGGTLAFGPDGMLYIGVGEGKPDNKKDNAQDLSSMYGSILRINIDEGQPYTIPKDNPFINGPTPEIWAYGLRNPYRFSFDHETGFLICGDVGDQLKEEVNIIEKGKNYGWPIYEGSVLSKNQTPDSLVGLHTLPIIEYDHKPHDWGQAIVGSFVYKGDKYAEFKNKVVLTDWSGDMFITSNADFKNLIPVSLDKIEESSMFADSTGVKYYINSIRELENGEIYLVGQHGVGEGNGLGSLFRIKNPY